MDGLSVNHPSHILIAADEANDRLLFERAFAAAGLGPIVSFASDGSELLNLLENQPPESVPLTIIDLGLPRIRAYEAIRSIRTHAAFSKWPIVMMSDSESQAEINEAYAQGANTLFVKPTEDQGFEGLVTSLLDYWKRYAQFPSATSSSSLPD